MRWVLIRPLNVSPWYDPEVQEPLGLEYLAAQLISQGEKCLILDAPLESMSNTRLARRAMAFQPDIIGFSMTTAQEVNSVTEIVRECKLLAKREIKWLAGGNFITSEPEFARHFLGDDFILARFDGEPTIALLQKELKNYSGFARINSPVCSQSVKDLDSLNFPVRPFIKTVLSQGWAVNIQGSRGCCGNCSYCSSPGMSPPSERRWRGRSIGSIVNELEQLVIQHKARAFNFIDEDFLGPPKGAEARALTFAEEISSRGLRITFGIQVRPISLSDEALEALISAGLKYVFLGIESDSKDDFKRWGRPWTADPWQFVNLLQHKGIEVNCGTLMFHPESTLKGIRSFAEKLKDHGLLDCRTALNRLDAMPGSRMYVEAVKKGLINSSIPGPQALPFKNDKVALLHSHLITAISPLEATAMHALCSLPSVTSMKDIDQVSAAKYLVLKQLISELNQQVESTFFSILETTEKDAEGKHLVTKLQKENLAASKKGIERMIQHSLLDSPTVIYEAVEAASR